MGAHLTKIAARQSARVRPPFTAVVIAFTATGLACTQGALRRPSALCHTATRHSLQAIGGSLQVEHGIDLGQEEEDEGHGVVKTTGQSQHYQLEQLAARHQVGRDEADDDDYSGAGAHDDEAALIEVVGQMSCFKG